MARRRRIYVPGASVHVIQRGINSGRIFCDEEDRYVFLAYLNFAAQTRGVSVHVFSLMTNHYHLLVTPLHATALPRTVKHFGGRYVQYFNRKYARRGTLWDGRYRPMIVGDERYFFTCMRYIEHNAVRAGIVKEPAAYRWSSYRTHALGEPSPWLVPHPLYLSLGETAQQRWVAYRVIYDAFAQADWPPTDPPVEDEARAAV